MCNERATILEVGGRLIGTHGWLWELESEAESDRREEEMSDGLSLFG